MDSSNEPEARRLVDHERGLVSPTIFIEPAVYRQELEQIFGRCWLFLAHESQVAESGSFTSARMGEEQLLVCRGSGGGIGAFLNMCPSCGALLSRADSGKAATFGCPEGLSFDLDGRVLLEDPGMEGGLSPSDELTLIRVRQLDSYKGCIFGSFDAEAPPLDVFLGDIRWGLDLMLEQGNLKVAGVTRWTVDSNWKFAAESSVNDIYHGLVHLSALYAENDKAEERREREMSLERPGFTMITEFGHGLNAEYLEESLLNPDDLMQHWRQDPVLQRRLGSFRMQVYRSCITLFPNAMISPSTREMHLWHPSGVDKTDIWLLTFSNEDDPPEVRRAFQRFSQLRRGPAGLYAQDESENWEQSTQGSRGVIVSGHTLNYQMGLGHGEIIDDEQSPPRIESLINEHRQLWFYRNWAHAMSVSNWEDWQKGLPRPSGRV